MKLYFVVPADPGGIRPNIRCPRPSATTRSGTRRVRDLTFRASLSMPAVHRLAGGQSTHSGLSPTITSYRTDRGAQSGTRVTGSDRVIDWLESRPGDAPMAGNI